MRGGGMLRDKSIYNQNEVANQARWIGFATQHAKSKQSLNQIEAKQAEGIHMTHLAKSTLSVICVGAQFMLSRKFSPITMIL